MLPILEAPILVARFADVHLAHSAPMVNRREPLALSIKVFVGSACRHSLLHADRTPSNLHDLAVVPYGVSLHEVDPFMIFREGLRWARNVCVGTHPRRSKQCMRSTDRPIDGPDPNPILSAPPTVSPALQIAIHRWSRLVPPTSKRAAGLESECLAALPAPI